MTERKRPVVYVVACGGTIAGKAAAADDLTGYTAGEATVGEMLAAVPDIGKYACVKGRQFCNIDSSDMTEALWLDLARLIQELADGDADGIVVTHGTDSMEETAYFLNLTVHTKKPVVLTGSMRPATAISADGPLNLLEAVQTAACREAGQYGVLQVMNGRICSARFVEKTDTTHADAFTGRQAGFMGVVQDGKPVFYQRPLRRHTAWSSLSCAGVQSLPPVAVLYCCVGMEAWAASVLKSGLSAVVVAGFGHGRMPAALWQLLRPAMEKGLVIVRASRTMGGAVTPVPEYEGTVCADSLTPQKAKILVQLALLQTRKAEEIQEIFSAY